jgi:tape measure domain-containing protein
MDGGKVIYRFEADDSDLKQKTLSVGDIVKGNLISSAVTTGISKVYNGIKNITSSVSSLAVQGGFNRALSIEQAEFKLQGLGHSAEEVDKIMENSLASVKGTAYGLDEAATVAASAVAAGVKPGEDLERTLKLVGDAATISGRDMNSMGAIFNKVAASGKMTGEELNQLTDAGIPMLQLLGDSLGKTNEEVRDMVSKGKIGFDEFRNAIEQGMSGAALTMGQTFSGALDNTKAAMSRLGKTFMDPFMKGMTPALGTLTDIIDMVASGTTKGLEEKTKLLSDQLGGMINNVLDSLLPLIENAIPVLEQLLTNLLNKLPGLLDKILPIIINLALDLIKALADVLPTLIPVLVKGIVSAVKGLSEVLPQVIEALIQGLILITQALAEEAPTLIPVLVDAILEIIPILIDNLPLFIKAGWQLIIGLAQGILNSIPTLLSYLPKIGSSMINYFKQLPSIFVEIGGNIIRGLINGIGSMASAVISKVKSLAKSILNGMKSVLGIHSPSTEFAILGKFSVLGYTKALEGMKSEVQDTIDSMFNLQPNINGAMSSTYNPNMVINVQNNMKFDPLGQVVSNIKTYSGGAKNDFNYGGGIA